ncbi:putative F-box domain-containing protein [Tanacetum coccineum]|uniref:F-box domain-containing protein n=1 Tax=Tanacetum coccineum TaxID=301880 RepID=A0ABQ5DEA4_9ASTR
MEVSYRLLRLYNFIASYTFTQTQLHHLLIRYQSLQDFKQKYVSIADNDTFPQYKISHTVLMSIEQLYDDPVVVGSSYGLFCFYGYYSGMSITVVWNPSIRKSVSVVVPNVFHGLYENVLGFGVCGNPYDVKIVKVTYVHIWKGMQSISSVPYQVKVFELSSGVWRIPCGNLPRKSIRFTWSQVFVDGFIYWFAFDRIRSMDYDGFQSCNLIMSFDIISEEHREICLLDSLALIVDVDNPISKVRESLVVLEYNIYAENPVYSVWMMEDGFSKSFTKLFTINTPGASIKTILGFRKNGDVIVETSIKDYEAALEVYEPCSEHINGLGIRGEVGSFYGSSYMETLLLLDHSDCSMYSSR